MIDSGSSINCIKRKIITPEFEGLINHEETINLKGISPQPIKTEGTCLLNFKESSIKFHLVSDNFQIPFDGILGAEFLSQTKSVIDFQRNVLGCFGAKIPFIKCTIKKPQNDGFEAFVKVGDGTGHSKSEGSSERIKSRVCTKERITDKNIMTTRIEKSALVTNCTGNVQKTAERSCQRNLRDISLTSGSCQDEKGKRNQVSLANENCQDERNESYNLSLMSESHQDEGKGKVYDKYLTMKNSQENINEVSNIDGFSNIQLSVLKSRVKTIFSQGLQNIYILQQGMQTFEYDEIRSRKMIMHKLKKEDASKNF